MLIDGPITSETVDSSGEILKLKGHDISDFLEGRAYANFEHNNDSPENIIGKFVYAKKIFNESDCENDRQRLFWKQLQIPFLYGICELFDDEDHPGAVAIAAILRYFKRRKEPVRIGFSIEGATLSRDDNVLERTVGRRAAVTLRPCNRTCWADVLSPEDAGDMVSKMESSATQTVEVDSAIVEDTPPTPELDLKIAVHRLSKTLTAGVGNVAPSILTQGSALSTEGLATKSRMNALRAAVRDWDRRRPLKEMVKAYLPDVSDDYVDHFVDLANQLSLQKGRGPIKLPRIGSEHSKNAHADSDQKMLLEGLYLHPKVDLDAGTHPIVRTKNDAGDEVIVKMPHRAGGRINAADASSAYYQMAKNFFGLGAHVPTTNSFYVSKKHAPWAYKEWDTHDYDLSRPWSAMKHIDGNTVLDNYEAYEAAFDRNRPIIHRLTLMDYLTGTTDRHLGNAMIDAAGNLYHIDNDTAFSHYLDNMPSIPFYLGDDRPAPNVELPTVHNDVVDAQTLQWLNGLDPKKMAGMMKAYGLPSDAIKGAVRRLRKARELMSQGHPIGKLYERDPADG
jgi:hypothetical protein